MAREGRARGAKRAGGPWSGGVFYVSSLKTHNFGRKLYCNDFVPLTPTKVKQDESSDQSQVKDQAMGLSRSPPAAVRPSSPRNADYTPLPGTVSTHLPAPATVRPSVSGSELYTPLLGPAQTSPLELVGLSSEALSPPGPPAPGSTCSPGPLGSQTGKLSTISDTFMQSERIVLQFFQGNFFVLCRNCLGIMRSF